MSKQFRPEQVDMEMMCTITIYCPEIYRRRDFVDWLNHEDTTAFTLHQKGRVLTDFADVALIYSGDDSGPDDDMPEDIWEMFCEEWKKHYSEEDQGMIFLRNYHRPMQS